MTAILRRMACCGADHDLKELLRLQFTSTCTSQDMPYCHKLNLQYTAHEIKGPVSGSPAPHHQFLLSAPRAIAYQRLKSFDEISDSWLELISYILALTISLSSSSMASLFIEPCPCLLFLVTRSS